MFENVVNGSEDDVQNSIERGEPPATVSALVGEDKATNDLFVWSKNDILVRQ